MWGDLHLLRDGTRVRVRPIRPADKAAMTAGYEHLSPETQRLRFLAPKPRLSAAELRYLTEIDGADHVALGAFLDEAPDIIIGEARFVRDADDPRTAEMAIIVGDRFQRRGLGGLLARQLADAARANGVTAFTATVLSENAAVGKLIALISERLEQTPAGPGVNQIYADLAA